MKKKDYTIFWMSCFTITVILVSYLGYRKIESFHNNIQKKSKICVLTQMKNETMNLKVWVEHYIWQGMDKIYIIDNGSTDDPLTILKPYIDSGKVVYYDLPEKHKQKEHYVQVIETENLRDKTEWLIICDLDEFYYGFPNRIIETIDDYSKFDIIYTNWKMFGSDGFINHPKDIRKSIVWREPEEREETTKYIFKPSKVANMSTQLDIHRIDGLTNETTENEKIRLNHYPIQSIEFFTKIKMTRGDVAHESYENVRDMQYFKDYDKNKTHKDTDLASLLDSRII